MKKEKTTIAMIIGLSVLLCTNAVYAESTMALIDQDSFIRISTDSIEDEGIIMTSDSARVVSPPLLSILSGDTITYELEVFSQVDSVMLLVHHSMNVTDTLAVLAEGPYRAEWVPGPDFPNHDQLNLRFGYILFHPDSTEIHSPPLAHRWIYRGEEVRRSSSRYISIETLEPDSFTIDGHFDEWGSARVEAIEDKAHFKMLWSSSRLFFAISVRDSSITPGDYVELHIDLHESATPFAGINHRSIRFGPNTRSNTVAPSIDDYRFVVDDSIGVRISREMKWRPQINDTGYTIEAKIPFTVLSDLEFPPRRFGFDVTIMDLDEGEQVPSFYSWSGSIPTNRYSPQGWGRVVLRQAMFPLKLFMVILLIIISIIIIIVVANMIHQKKKEDDYEKMEEEGFSETTENILTIMDRSLSDPHFCIESLAKETSLTTQQITENLEKELGNTFEHMLSFRRITLSKSLMRQPDADLKQIAKECGYENYEAFSCDFSKIMKRSPDVYFKAVLEQLEEERQEEEEDKSTEESSTEK
ncbi:sugar-binding protein [Chitinispirillales bacterium ANBcel5]|uniref:sugar-binding protein n=1 Tax=Cellulosispirillum alkaliphilum TaxID=3039283 RepID=UPI002A53AC1D|nr:sugar-binding protein [Chitinispirillales bacterium ANBcel5]